MLTPEALAVGSFLVVGLVLTLLERRAPVRANPGRHTSLLLDTAALAWSTVMTVLGVALAEWALADAPPVSLVLGAPVAFALFVVLADGCRYLAHRALHTPALWPSHRFHHSVEQLDWYAGNRAAPLHSLLFIVPTSLLAWALHIGPVGIAANSVLMVVWNALMHTNVRLPAGLQRAAEWVVTTPRYHHIHHSTVAEHGHANLASIFTVWDHLGGTAVDPDAVRPEGLVFGLGGSEDRPLWRLFLGV